MTWQLATTCDEVTPDAPFAFSSGEQKVAIYQVGAEYYATDNVCPHAYALMTDGFVEGDKVECPLHGAIFHIPTGRCLGPPADCDLKTYPLKIEGSQVFIDL
ncbi:non-heme iron oxygenase ferredoxin subunit (plasmid) [Cupriavidus basilensis]